jgi:hypothetical protein
MSWGRPKIDTSGLVFHAPLWHPKLWVASGSTFQSLDKYSHTCTVSGATYGKYGYTFDGANDYISVPVNSAFEFTTACTFLAWVKIKDWDFTGGSYVIVEVQDRIFWNFPSAAGQQLRFQQEGTWDYVDTPASAGQYYAADTWYCVGATFDVAKNPNTRLYWYGFEQANGNITAPLATAKPIWIGSYQNANHYIDGIVGEVTICNNRAFSASEMMRYYQQTKGRYVT